MAPLHLRDQVRLGVGIHEGQRVFVLEFRPEEPERKRARAEDDDAISNADSFLSHLHKRPRHQDTKNVEGDLFLLHRSWCLGDLVVNNPRQ